MKRDLTDRLLRELFTAAYDEIIIVHTPTYKSLIDKSVQWYPTVKDISKNLKLVDITKSTSIIDKILFFKNYHDFPHFYLKLEREVSQGYSPIHYIEIYWALDGFDCAFVNSNTCELIETILEEKRKQ